MAEGWARHLHGNRIDAYSAGIETHGLNPRAVRVMAEAGVDISAHRSKTVADLGGVEFDLVVTVCGHAHEHCPLFPGRTRVVHAGFDDPPRLAANAPTEEEALAHYRRVRDEIRAFVGALPASHLRAAAAGPAAPDAETVRQAVRDGYGSIARSSGSCCGGGPSCCGAPASPDDLVRAIGYPPDDLAALPDGANMGLSCGNPTAVASLRPGEVVLDLGAGGGFDAFIAGRKVGAAGRVIGVDMTADMVAKARRNTAVYRERTGLDNVEFRLGEIEHLPVADASVDVVISNCVINLSPDKPQVWREIARVLRPGGRVAVSDLALLRPLPEGVRDMVEALVGCIAGAVLVSDTGAMARQAGLEAVELEPKPDYIRAMTDGGEPLFRRIADLLPAGASLADYVTSLNVAARKPRRPGS
jgi:SAM-dependent methyltransferase